MKGPSQPTSMPEESKLPELPGGRWVQVFKCRRTVTSNPSPGVQNPVSIYRDDFAYATTQGAAEKFVATTEIENCGYEPRDVFRTSGGDHFALKKESIAVFEDAASANLGRFLEDAGIGNEELRKQYEQDMEAKGVSLRFPKAPETNTPIKVVCVSQKTGGQITKPLAYFSSAEEANTFALGQPTRTEPPTLEIITEKDVPAIHFANGKIFPLEIMEHRDANPIEVLDDMGMQRKLFEEGQIKAGRKNFKDLLAGARR